MQKIKILANTVCDGRRVKPGDFIEPSRGARYLVAIGKAEFAKEVKKESAKKKAPSNKAVSTDEIETR